MSSDFYTLIVVPHAKARFRKLQVSVRLTRWVTGAVGVAAILTGSLMFHYARIAAEVHQLRGLKEQNEVLLAKNKEYERSTLQLQAKVQNLHDIVSKLGVMAGLEQSLPEPQVGGVGGVPSAESLAPSADALPSLRVMDKSISDLTERSEQIERFYRDQSVLLASTPSIWPVRGYLSAGFGNRKDPFTGQPDFHPGIDISTPIGTKVHAPADGVVIFCGEKGGYGNAIVVDHQYGVVTRYAHLDRFNVKPGQKVRRGDVLGFVGSTGKSTAPHLHYEVWVRDQAQNPIHFILDEFRSFS